MLISFYGEGASPDKGAESRPGRSEESASDAAAAPRVYAASVIVTKDGDALTGYEPHGKPRVGMLTFPGGKLENDETYVQAAVRELEEEAGLFVRPEDLVKVREYQCGKLHCTKFTVDYKSTHPSSMLTADRLTDLKFRNAAGIIDEHAPNKLANCVKEVIVDGEFTPAVFKGESPLAPTTSLPADPLKRVRMHTPPLAAVSSPAQGSVSEVKTRRS